ncbi:MAG: Ig domain-containing protein [Butyrivibrio sp.]|nr:Ig domain-containing protein [Butyrivibrio sp.]
MRKKLFGRLLSIVLSATLAFTPSMTAFAGEVGELPEQPEETIEQTEEGESLEVKSEEEVPSVPEETPTSAEDETPAPEAEEPAEETPVEEEVSEEVEEASEILSVEEESELLTAQESDLPSAEEIRDAISVATLYDKAEKVNPVIEGYGVDVEVTGAKEITATIHGNNLKKHTIGDGQQAYLLGLAINRAALAKDGYSVKFYEGWNAPTENSEYSEYDEEGCEDTVNYPFYYGKLQPKDNKIPTFYVGIRYYVGDDIAKTYVITIENDVTLASTIEVPTNIIAATLHDTDDKNIVGDGDICKNYGIGEVTKSGTTITVPVTANELKLHKAGDDAGYGYWVGFGIPRISENITQEYEQSYVAKEEHTFKAELDNTMTVGEGSAAVTYDTVYFNANDPRLVDKKGYVYVKYTNSVNDETVIYTYVFDMSGVTIDEDLPEAQTNLIAAKLHDETTGSDFIADDELYDANSYALGQSVVTENTIRVPVTITGLKQHKAGGAGQGYWIGFGIPRVADHKTEFKQAYNKAEIESKSFGPELDNTMTEGTGESAVTYDTVYFNAADPRLVDSVGYVLVKYWDKKEKNSVVYTYEFDMSGVQMNNGLPELTADVVSAPIVDKAAKPKTDLYTEGTYQVGPGVLGEDGKTVTVPISVKGLVEHDSDAPAPYKTGYWVGFGIPKQTGVTTYYKQSYTKIADPSNISWTDTSLDSTVTVNNKTYDTVYFNANGTGDKALVDKTGYVYVKYTAPRGDEVIYTYVVDMGGVELSGMPTIAQATGVVAPTLEDHPTEGFDKITNLYTEYGIDEVTGSNGNYTVTVTATDLRAHMNGQGTNGYWVGTGFYWPKGTANNSNVTTKYYMNYTTPATGSTEFREIEAGEDPYVDPKDGTSYLAMYWNMADNRMPENKKVYAGIEYISGSTSQRYYYTIDLSNVTTLNDYPTVDQLAAIQKAPIADTSGTDVIPEGELSTGYKAEYLGTGTWTDVDGKSNEGLYVSVSADDIVKHKAGATGEAGLGYWAGIAIPEITGANYTVQYAQSYGSYDGSGFEWKNDLDSYLTDKDGNITHRTVYFNAGSNKFVFSDSGKTGYVYVKYTSKRDTSDSKIYRYAVDLSRVKFNIASDVNNIIPAKLHDNAEGGYKDDALFTKDTYNVTTSSELDEVSPSTTPYTVPVKVTAKDLKQHMASEGAGYGFWVGIGLPQSLRTDASQTVRYAYSTTYPTGLFYGKWFEGGDLEWADYKDFFDSEIAKYDTVYINAEKLAGTTAKRYVSVVVAEGETIYNADSAAVIVYELDFSEITLSKTEYDVEISETANNIGKLIKAGTTGSVTVRAHVTNTDDEKIAKGVPVKWVSSDNNIATVAGDASTGADGYATATITFNSINKAAIVSISAIADSASAASVKYELYEFVESPETTLDLELPGETEAVLSPTFILPVGSEYAIRWSKTSDTRTDDGKATAKFDNDGVVYAVNNGTAKFAQAIIDPESGLVVDKMGRTDRESGLLKTADDYYTVNVTTALSSAWIVQNKDVYANEEDSFDVFGINYSPETFDPNHATVSWSSSNRSVATITADGVIRGIKKGATTIQATITVGDKVYKASYVLRVKPAITSISIKKQGSDDELEYVSVKKGNVVKLVADITADDEDADYSVTWYSRNPSIASVAPNGTVTGFGQGNTEIVAVSADGKTDEIYVYVYEYITSISTNVSNLNMAVGDKVAVSAAVTPENAYYSTYWTSNNSEVVAVEYDSVSETYFIRAIAKGSAQVTVKDTDSGLSASIKVTVGGKDTALTAITPVTTDYTLYVGKQADLAFTTKPANYTNTVFNWASSDESVATVTNGKVTAISEGTTKITVEAYKMTGELNEDGTNKTEATGIKATYDVTVKAAPVVESISIEPKSLTLQAPVAGIKAGESARLIAKTYPEYATGTVTWASSDQNTVSVTSEGVVTAQKSGTAVISATSGTASQSIVVTVTDEIDAADLNTGRYAEGAAWIGAIDDYIYTGSAIKPEPNVYYGTVLLTPGVDYTYSYKNNTNAARSKNEPTVTVKLKGNYAGTATASFVINPAYIDYDVTVNNVSAVGKLNKKTGAYAEQLLKPVLTFNGKTLKAGTDYDLYYLDDDEDAYEVPGTWPITIVGKGNYTGETTADEIIVNPANAVKISKAVVSGVEKSYPYNGYEIIPENMVVTYQANKSAAVLTLTEGSDYTVTFSNNVGLGTATATITGMGQFFGTKKVTYKIVPETVDLSTATITVGINGEPVEVTGTKASDIEIPYAKGGTKPSSVTVSYGDYDLTSADYTWTNKVNAKAGIGTVTIKGKGKFYKKSATVAYKIVKQEISNLTFAADDFVYAAKAKAYEKNKITVYDLDGKALKVKTDYTIAFEAESAIPSIGSYVTATITGTGNYEGKATVSFKVIDKAYKLSAASLSFLVDDEEIAANKFYIKYAGSPVTISEDDIVLKIKKKVGRTTNLVTIDSNDYEIVAIQNNNKVGKATVIIKGTGEYGGLKTINFSIKK